MEFLINIILAVIVHLDWVFVLAVVVAFIWIGCHLIRHRER